VLAEDGAGPDQDRAAAALRLTPVEMTAPSSSFNRPSIRLCRAWRCTITSAKAPTQTRSPSSMASMSL